jgi:hypothetical protein
MAYPRLDGAEEEPVEGEANRDDDGHDRNQRHIVEVAPHL